MTAKQQHLLETFAELDAMMDYHRHELNKFSAGIRLQEETTQAIISGSGDCEIF